MNARILLVEDDMKTASTVMLYLFQDGFEADHVSSGVDALQMVRESRPDLVILDVMLPLLDGYDVCRIIRAESDVPIIMLTARTLEQDQLHGLNVGADDYVTKPFSPRMLLARVKALLRRAQCTAACRPIPWNTAASCLTAPATRCRSTDR